MAHIWDFEKTSSLLSRIAAAAKAHALIMASGRVNARLMHRDFAGRRHVGAPVFDMLIIVSEAENGDAAIWTFCKFRNIAQHMMDVDFWDCAFGMGIVFIHEIIFVVASRARKIAYFYQFFRVWEAEGF